MSARATLEYVSLHTFQPTTMSVVRFRALENWSLKADPWLSPRKTIVISKAKKWDTTSDSTTNENNTSETTFIQKKSIGWSPPPISSLAKISFLPLLVLIGWVIWTAQANLARRKDFEPARMELPRHRNISIDTRNNCIILPLSRPFTRQVICSNLFRSLRSSSIVNSGSNCLSRERFSNWTWDITGTRERNEFEIEQTDVLDAFRATRWKKKHNWIISFCRNAWRNSFFSLSKSSSDARCN